MYTFEFEGTRYGVILPPKTATRSYENALKRIGAKANSGRHGCPKELIQQQGVIVASVRHPCDVLVSWYHYDRRGARTGISFAGFIGLALSGEHDYLSKSTLPGAEHASKFLRYEDGPFNAWKSFQESIGMEPDCSFFHIGAATGRKPWKAYYTGELLHVVGRAYKKDFQRFGYEAKL
jgi:hypothetical protein